MKKIKPFLKISKIIVIGILTAVLLLNITGIFKRVFLKQQLPLVFGYGSAVVVTGSMEPVIAPGDLIIIHKQSDYSVGDIVTYQSNSPITHRITEKTPDGYIIKGDANNMVDGEIKHDRIIGKVVKILPNVGNIILFFQSPLGMLILIGGLFAVIEAPGLFKRLREKTMSRKA